MKPEINAAWFSADLYLMIFALIWAFLLVWEFIKSSQNVSFPCCLSFSQNAYGVYFSKAAGNSIILGTESLLSNLVDTGQWVWKLLDETFRESCTNKCKNVIAIKAFSKRTYFIFLCSVLCTGKYNKEILRNKLDCWLRLRGLRGKNNNKRFPGSWKHFGKQWPLQIFTG